MCDRYTTRRGRVSIQKILEAELYTYDRYRTRIDGRGVRFTKKYPCQQIYFTDQDQLRAVGESLAAVGGRSLLNSAFGDLNDRGVCVGDMWNGIAGFYR